MKTCPTCDQVLPDEDLDTFGYRMKEARIALGWGKEDLADILGYNRTTQITRWEECTLTPRDIDVVETLAGVLEVTPAWLLYGVQEPKLFEVEDAIVTDDLDDDIVEGHGEFFGAEDEPVPETFTNETDTDSSGESRPAILDKIKGS